MKELSLRQLQKYYCTYFLEDIGDAGQIKLLQSKVLVVGAGGLGSTSIAYLSSIGLDTLGIVDFDRVSMYNLPRQILYGEADSGKYKVDVIKERLKGKNKDTIIKTYKIKINKDNVKDIIKDYDIVLDCVDNFDTKFVLNDACIALGIPLVCAGVSGFKGQVMMVTRYSNHDFKSLFSKYPKVSKTQKDKDKGVFPLAVGIVSTIQCAEAIKYLLGIGQPLTDEMLVIDTIKMSFERFKI